MANTKTYSVRLSDFDIKALEFLQKEFEEDSKESGIPLKYSRSDVIRALVWISIRESAEVRELTISDMLGLDSDN